MLDFRPDPSLFVWHFDSVVFKMTESLFSESPPARASAVLFFRKLFVPDADSVNFHGVFSSLASMCVARDRSPRGYCALAHSILHFVGTRAALTADEMELLAKVVRPLAVFSDEGSRRAIEAFAGELERFACGCGKGAVDGALTLITEFAAPDIRRARVLRADSTSA
jgi:hypothetical protein